MRFEERFELATDPQRTFDYLADIRNEVKWNPWARSVEKVGNDPIGEGTRFRVRYKRLGNVEQWLAEFRPPQHVVYRSPTMDGTMTFDIEPGPSGSNVALIAAATPTGVMKLMAPLMTPMMRRHIRDLAVGLTRELGSRSER